MIRSLRYTFILLGALLVAACTGIPVSTDYEQGWQLPSGATYAWLSRSESAPRDPLVDNDLVQRRIMSAVDDVLQAKGLSAADEGGAELLVAYHVAQEEKIDIDTFHSWYGYYPCWGCFGHPAHFGSRFGYDRWGYGPGTDVWVREYTEGTLVVDLVDAKTRQLVWRGAAARRVPTLNTPAERNAFIRETVNAIFRDFPPGTAAH